MRILFFIVLFSFAGHEAVFAQRFTEERPLFSIYVMPCQLLPMAYAGGATIGAEFKIYSRFSLTLEGGGFYAPGFMAKTNLKYYLHRGDAGQNYLAIECAYKKQSYIAWDNHREFSGSQGAPTAGAAENYSVHKSADILNLKNGCVVAEKHGWYIDGYYGVGIKYVETTNSLIPGQEGELYHWNEGFIDAATNAAFKGYTLSLSLGVKVGYNFKRRSETIK